MFTIKPAKKPSLNLPGANSNGANGKNGNGNGNGHKNGNGNGHTHGIDSVLGPGVFFKGALTGTGNVRVEGTFEGTVNLKGALVVGEGAKVTAEIQAEAVSVAGSVKGNIQAGKVDILATGRIFGDLTTAAFATEEGAFLRGQITMQDALKPVEELQ